MKPFFTFYGGKWRAAPHYPKPKYDIIIEPFAGSAGYSVRYWDRSVILVEIDPKIAATWRCLTTVSKNEILSLPDVEIGQTVDDLNVCREARLLIGWWLNKGSSTPCKSPSSWMRSFLSGELKGNPLFWSDRVRSRIAEQVEYIRHWTVIEASCTDIADIDLQCTWFIDPPYINAGKHYRHGSNGIDYDYLSEWICSRSGQIIVCENDGADWLPFEPYLHTKASESSRGGKISKESIFTFDTSC